MWVLKIIHHQHHRVSVGVIDGEQVLNFVCPVDPGPARSGDHPATTGQRFDPDEDRAGAVSDVLTIFLPVASGCGLDRAPGMSQELIGFFI